MANLSTFPQQVDTFIEHRELNPDTVPTLAQYQELRLRTSLTSVETERMNELLSILRDRLFLAEDFNKLQDAITNLQTFFKYQTETYIAELFASYDAEMTELEQRSDDKIAEIQQRSDDKIAEIQQTIDTTNGWISTQTAILHDSEYFNFDNMSYRAGFKLVYNKVDNTYNEQIINVSDGSVFATRVSVKNAESDYTVTTVCGNVVPQINVVEHIYKNESGDWINEVT